MNLTRNVYNCIDEHLRARRWRLIVAVMACVVAFLTYYSLTLPAITVTNDLTRYLTDARILIDGEEYDTDDTIPVSKEFAISLQFSNINSRDGTSFTYILPDEIILSEDITDGELADAQGSKQGTYTVSKNEATGRYVVWVNFDEDYAARNDYLDMNLEISANWNVDSSGEVDVDFGNDHVRKVKIDADTKLAIEKTHTQTGKRSADFSIEISAVTAQQNVRLTDSITHQSVSYTKADGTDVTEQIGAALKVGGTIRASQKDKNGNVVGTQSFAISDQASLNTYLSSASFSMNAGDTLTITYPMEFAEGTAYTADSNDLTLKTTNTASVSSNEMQNALSAAEEWIYTGEKGNIIQKKGEMTDDENDSLRWDLTLNASGNYPMAGTVVYDKLQSTKLNYDTAKPFIVEAYDGETLVRTITISNWSGNSDGLQLTDDGRGWEYTIPTLTDDGNEEYIYKINYYTTVTDYDGTALNNAAGARFSQYPEVSIVGKATKIDIGIEKIGERIEGDADASAKTVEWTIKYIVHSGSGIIHDFVIADFLPKYKNTDGESVYTKLVDAQGNALTYPADNTEYCRTHDVYEFTVTDNLNETDYTQNDDFAFLNEYRSYNAETDFALCPSSGGFTLPAAVGDYANGYVISIKYRTQSPGIAQDGELNNIAQGRFTGIDGNTQYINANAKVNITSEDLENSVTIDKTGSYDTETGIVHYSAKIDTGNVGFREANTVTITDTYDERLIFDESKYTLKVSLDSTELSFLIELREQNTANVKTEKTANADGTTTWKTTFLTTPLYAKGHGSSGIPLEVHTTIDPDNHTFKVFLPYLYEGGETLETLRPLTYQLVYDMTPDGSLRMYKDVSNAVTAVGDNGVTYGTASTTFSFGKNITTKTLTDAQTHTHSEADCYTFDISQGGNVLTCPLSEGEANNVLFKVRIDFGADELKNLTRLTVDDFMDTDKIPPDLSKLKLRFVGSVYGSDTVTLSMEDACMLGGITGVSYETTMTAAGISTDIDLGTTVENFINTFYESDGVRNYTGVAIDLSKWKLELSYPASVRGNISETVHVTNKANLRGIANSDSSVDYDKIIQGSSGGVSGRSYTINIEKIDATVTGGNVTYLLGAAFRLCDERGNVIAEASTDSTGKAAFGRNSTSSGYCVLEPYKAYYLVETAAPSGYVRDATKHWFYFTAPDGTAEQTSFTEEQKASLEALGCMPVSMDSSIRLTNSNQSFIKIKKVDSETLQPLTDAEFKLYSDSTCLEEIQLASTSGDGIYLFDGLQPGEIYYLKETKPPDGYRLSDEIYTVTVSADGSVTVVDGAGDTLYCEEETLAYRIENSKGAYTLPQTGAPGTKLLYAIGILLLAAGLLYGCVKSRIRYKNNFLSNNKEKGL